MASSVWVNIESGHFKVWGFDAFHQEDTGEGRIITYWGKIGLPMHKLRKHEKTFTSWGDAYNYARAKVDEKLWKGYKAIANGKYFDFIYNDKPLSELIQAIERIKEG